MEQDTRRRAGRNPPRISSGLNGARVSGLLLPGALLVAVGAKFLAPFMLVDFRFATFFQ
jgi:hypothetical protein